MIIAVPKPAKQTAGRELERGTKFGISVTRKAGGAVRRNRLKRIVREYIRTHKSFWPENLLVVIRINRPVTDETDLLIEIEDMLKSAR
jgi:ribonuclease P protein component